MKYDTFGSIPPTLGYIWALTQLISMMPYS